MSQVSIWFERKFEFGFDITLLPNLLSRLRGTPARLEESVRGRPREILMRKSGDGWSALQQAGHLGDMEPLWIARVGDFSGGGTELTAADLTNRKTHEGGHNARETEELLAAFRAERAQLLASVDCQHATAFERAILHPRLRTPMRLADHLLFVAEHDDHHLARIWELVEEHVRR